MAHIGQREPGAGAFLVAAALALGACETISLDGLTGGTALPSSEEESDASMADTGGGSTMLDSGGLPEALPPPDAAIDGGGCGADGGGIVCGGQCVDPSSDPSNCGACGVSCPTGACGSSITAPMTTAPAGWTFNGSAFYNKFAPSAELTPIGNHLAGTVVYAHAVTVDAFDVTFEFRMGLQGGTRSDGMGFMIETEGSSALGKTGPGLGMTGLTGYGVELDIQNNGVCGDISNDQAGVDDLALCNASQMTPTSLFASPDLSSMVDLGDGQWHSAEITLTSGAVSVSVNGVSVASNVSLPGLGSGAPYYFGFAGGTGGLLAADGGVGGFRQEVRDIVIKFPTPRCL